MRFRAAGAPYDTDSLFHKDKPSECYDVDIVLSVGGGMRPTASVGTINALQLDPGLFGAAKVAYSVGHLMKFAVEQVCARSPLISGRISPFIQS